MPLFPSDEIESFSISNIMATKLINATKGRTHKPVSATRSEAHFQILIAQHGEDTVSKILDFYITTIGKEYAIQAYSGKSFREKFTRIKAQYEKSVNKPSLNKDAQRVLDIARENYCWPRGAETQLSSFVQKSFDNYSTFLDQFRAYKPRPNSDEWFLHRYLKESRYCSPIEFTLFWIEFIQDVLERWEEWNGSLNSYVWNLKNDWTIRKESGVAYDYGVRCEVWERFIDNITKN